ncbi:potassium transporter KefB [Pseudochryseolinea flava]|uniref:Potassium transporter KefB n=1 Tax=Pseudochryseolinea flava TaxID=2059302 RepID=A0A364Y765_9BACT|nr:potassium transporter KefB [Pseudochryseolinea flava]RAW02237.1 potassium transporter KefB [Pseudochryseolinea flava]
MTQAHDSAQPQPFSLSKRMLIGAGIGLLAILFFLVPGEANPEWSKFWMIRPLIIVPLAGAMGGMCNYYILQFQKLVGLNKIVAVVLSILVFIVGLWMGIVLGLDGTMWD